MSSIDDADLTPGVAVPALGLLEFSSIALGIRAADAMVKKAPIRALVAGSVQPGKYLVLIDGDEASVEESLAAGLHAGAPSVVDRLYLPNAHPAVGKAIAGQRYEGEIEALGIIETRTTAGTLRAADAAIKGASVELIELRMANGLGGKGLSLYSGTVADIEAAIEIGTAVVESGNLVQQVVVPQLHEEMAENILAGTRFVTQFGESEG
ncbi:MAG: BMC domain-containing protein [Candidatus Eisenbacteria bacterium]|uniref:BMC domain-containing protein n=1 Tax=Eiseniibacteriota bacterium TaxID=2212470 RepID=A0A7Y2EDR9_UNCEI|nr:BMC domain-containing protein [Candidatus Eisenbacteria bacterium]